ncbi:hypothetical protein Ecwhy1_42 [Escherichia phage Ecwhy_1]|nr:hypothetical protein Ecwhy1_42 [Escherichia phage Ecwhy_1]
MEIDGSYMSLHLGNRRYIMRVVINPAKSFMSSVYGADDIIRMLPRIEIDGIEVRKYGNIYYVVNSNGNRISDSLFFSTEEMKHLIIID